MRIYSRVNAGANPLLHVTLNDFKGLEGDSEGVAERLKKFMMDDTGDISQFNCVEINGVKDNDSLYFGDAGFLMHQSEQIPDTLNVQLLVIESDEDIRKFAVGADDIIGSDIFKATTGSVLAALAAVAPIWAG